MSPLLHLPPELWLQIGFHLPYFTVENNLRPTCKAFYRLFAKRKLYGLTPKIWENILSYLFYYRLKRMKQVSRDFRDLLLNARSSYLLHILFRQPLPPETIPHGTWVTINPIIPRLCINWEKGLVGQRERPLFSKSWMNALEPQSIHSIFRETLTSPPVRSVIIQGHGDRQPIVIGQGLGDEESPPKPVTIGMLVHAVYTSSDMWNLDVNPTKIYKMGCLNGTIRTHYMDQVLYEFAMLEWKQAFAFYGFYEDSWLLENRDSWKN